MDIEGYNLIYNFLSFAIAAFGASSIFFFFQRSQVAPAYRTALTLSGLVCLISFYHYLRLFESFNDAYIISYTIVNETGIPFKAAYRYVGWLLTIPLLLLQLILVMRVSKKETYSMGLKLTIASVLMVIFGYPGETLVDINQFGERISYWLLAMMPFLYILYNLIIVIKPAINKQPKNVRGLISNARWLLIFSWALYPIVYLFPIFNSDTSTVQIQLGYTIADIISIAAYGVMIYLIAQQKSDVGS